MDSQYISCFIFDVDGLLLDTEGIYTKVTQEIVGRFGKEFNWSIKGKMIGRNSHDAARILIDTLALPLSPQEFLDLQKNRFEELFPTAQPMPGALELTRELCRRRIPTGVATSSPRPLFELKTSLHREWFSCFKAVVTGDDPELERPKPAPDIFLLAARRLGMKPESCLVFEDAPSGVEAALAAGMKVVAVPDPNMDRNAYRNAHLILSSLEEFDLQGHCDGLTSRA